ncbi:helix-turn-helix domain-containing protein [Rhodohalobacter sp. 614A]|uniref:helix-turn-helix domain-containing protein n=1 Tax=Rhodohalobacter sp. 614A TaxID=2908649 RepID=UPI001F25350C|nr:AraC family transcriptional regulator [Rhodohalobacter sp. 614A]
MLKIHKINRRTYPNFVHHLYSVLFEAGITPHSFSDSSDDENRKEWRLPSDVILKDKVGKVIIYIEQHLTEDLSLNKLADEIELSKYQLIRGFQKEEGTTPWKFLVHKRIENVKKLLEDGMSPGQAAVESGFYDQSHMNKAFREATGQTPKEYQEKNFKNKN